MISFLGQLCAHGKSRRIRVEGGFNFNLVSLTHRLVNRLYTALSG